MFRIRSVVRPVAVALALAFVAVPVTAMADEPAAKQHRHHERAEFPMPAKDFKQLEAHKVPAALQTEIKKRFEEGAKIVRQAAEQAASDGTVTKEEADKVRTIAQDLKKKAQKDLHAKRAGKAKRDRKA